MSDPLNTQGSSWNGNPKTSGTEGSDASNRGADIQSPPKYVNPLSALHWQPVVLPRQETKNLSNSSHSLVRDTSPLSMLDTFIYDTTSLQDRLLQASCSLEK
ncbi:hypothetical protein MKZ38_007565 [Zalerion maritima]|uniref:Uncharacterized protein n=1 Tax=Zalerion maritima TaxID=339359 RepID=A0AAD5RHX4_9PEZI|nr:hypothetical protein MKZ38_007565 [Zalerion maritima]